MAITTQINKPKELTTFTVTGVLAFVEVLKVVDTFYYGNPTTHVLWNLLGTTDVHLTPEQMERIAVYQPRFEGRRDPGKTAFVAQEDSLLGLLRRFEMESGARNAPFSIRIFQNLDEAYQWIDDY